MCLWVQITSDDCSFGQFSNSSNVKFHCVTIGRVIFKFLFFYLFTLKELNSLNVLTNTTVHRDVLPKWVFCLHKKSLDMILFSWQSQATSGFHGDLTEPGGGGYFCVICSILGCAAQMGHFWNKSLNMGHIFSKIIPKHGSVCLFCLVFRSKSNPSLCILLSNLVSRINNFSIFLSYGMLSFLLKVGSTELQERHEMGSW